MSLRFYEREDGYQKENIFVPDARDLISAKVSEIGLPTWLYGSRWWLREEGKGM